MRRGWERSRLASEDTETDRLDSRPVSAYPPTHRTQPLALIDEGFDPARAISKRPISHPNDRQ
jgi:hypothetical protein